MIGSTQKDKSHTFFSATQCLKFTSLCKKIRIFINITKIRYHFIKTLGKNRFPKASKICGDSRVKSDANDAFNFSI